MALILHNAGREPLGQFDGYVAAGTAETFLGGEIATWRGMPWPPVAAADVDNDGYVTSTSYGKEVPAISANWTTMVTEGRTMPNGPYFLTDDGTVGYGTLFGTVVGGTAGTQSNGPLPTQITGAKLGPATYVGSGKITVWDKQGLYGVTLDAVDTTNLTATSNVKVGDILTFTGAGKLTTSTNGVAGGSVDYVIGRIAEFETNGSLVTTPNNLVAALNSPSGSVTSLQKMAMTQVVFWYAGAEGGGVVSSSTHVGTLPSF